MPIAGSVTLRELFCRRGVGQGCGGKKWQNRHSLAGSFFWPWPPRHGPSFQSNTTSARWPSSRWRLRARRSTHCGINQMENVILNLAAIDARNAMPGGTSDHRGRRPSSEPCATGHRRFCSRRSCRLGCERHRHWHEERGPEVDTRFFLHHKAGWDGERGLAYR